VISGMYSVDDCTARNGTGRVEGSFSAAATSS
jgi:hypothetical protein